VTSANTAHLTSAKRATLSVPAQHGVRGTKPGGLALKRQLGVPRRPTCRTQSASARHVGKLRPKQLNAGLASKTRARAVAAHTEPGNVVCPGTATAHRV